VADLPRLAGRLEEIRRANVDHHAALIERAAEKGARLMGLGEMFTGPYFALQKEPMWHGLAESAAEGPTVTTLAALARRLSVVIVAPIYELARTGKRYNTAVVIDADGKILGKYRKTHIPMGKNEQGEFIEPFYFGPADDDMAAENKGAANLSKNPYFPVFSTAVGRVGVAICYDRHFEGVMPSLAKNGAEIVMSPAVTFGAKSERMWETEFEVDAMRHRVIIAGSNRLGSERPWGQPYFGRSYVTGPNGRATADRSVPGLVLSTVDLAELRGPDPSGWNLERDRRPSIYG
jgi:N-carbamoylputrescine amidase